MRRLRLKKSSQEYRGVESRSEWNDCVLNIVQQERLFCMRNRVSSSYRVCSLSKPAEQQEIPCAITRNINSRITVTDVSFSCFHWDSRDSFAANYYRAVTTLISRPSGNSLTIKLSWGYNWSQRWNDHPFFLRKSFLRLSNLDRNSFRPCRQWRRSTWWNILAENTRKTKQQSRHSLFVFTVWSGCRNVVKLLPLSRSADESGCLLSPSCQLVPSKTLYECYVNHPTIESLPRTVFRRFAK